MTENCFCNNSIYDDCDCCNRLEGGWYHIKDRLPPLEEVVECITDGSWPYSSLGRDYFAFSSNGKECFWITPSLNDMPQNELKVKYWRHIPPNPKGKKCYIKIKQRKTFWEPKVYFF